MCEMKAKLWSTVSQLCRLIFSLCCFYAFVASRLHLCSLQNMKAEFWGDMVTVVSCDMRQWLAPELADIIVSELLGSFGDNELSPECLDGAQRFLKGNLPTTVGTAYQ